MKTYIKELHGKATARIPNKTVKAMSWMDLSPLALKIFLRLIYEWDQHERHQERKGIPPEKRTLQGPIHIRWRELKAQLSPDAEASFNDYDYRELHRATIELANFHSDLQYLFKGKRALNVINLIGGASFFEESMILTYSLTNEMQLALRGIDHYAVIPLKEIIALEESRHIALFMLAQTVVNLRHHKAREIPIEQIKSTLELRSGVYKNWWRVWAKLQASAEVLNEKTGCGLTLEQVIEGNEVVTVRFTSSRNKNRLTPALAAPDDIKPALRKRALFHNVPKKKKLTRDQIELQNAMKEEEARNR